MRRLLAMMMAVGLMALCTMAIAQRPGGDASESDDLVARMMAFDADKDGKLTKSEVTDERLHRLFDRVDANHDGTVTKNELTAVAKQEQSKPRGRGGFGFGPPGGGPGGMMMMGPPRPGDILPTMVRQRLRLTDEQKTQVDELQKDVDAKLDKILTAEQKVQLKEMRERGPGGFGPPGFGPGRGRGGRGGGPPGGPGFGPPPGDGPPPSDGPPPD
jgi:EF hand